MNPLLKNAVVSVQLGLEDFASDDERRVISAARNLYAGFFSSARKCFARFPRPARMTC